MCAAKRVRKNSASTQASGRHRADGAQSMRVVWSVSPEPGPMATYARHVGRIGALAVALGVGAALATGHGIAAADTSDTSSTSDTSTGSDSSDSDASDAGSATDSTGDDSPPPAETPSEDQESDDTESDDTEFDDSGAVAPEPETTEPDDPEPEATEPEVVEETEPVDIPILVDTPAEQAPEPPVVDELPPPLDTAVDVDRTDAKPEESVIVAPEPTVVVSVVSADPEPVATRIAEDTVPTEGAVDIESARQSVTFVAAPTATITPPAPAGLLTTFLAAIGLSPLAVPGPLAPAEPPLIWAVLAWVRRTFFNQSPTAVLQQYPQSENGEITGVIAEDPDGDPITYTVVAPPRNGSVEFNSDGTYTYTPNDDPAANGGPDSFTVIASDRSGFHLHGLLGLFGAGHTTTITVPVTVTPVDANQAPNITVTSEPGRYPVYPHVDRLYDVVFFTVETDDPDGDPVTVTYTDPPDGSIIDLGDGKYVYVYGDGEHSQTPVYDTFTFTATDPGGLSATSDVQSVQVPVYNRRPAVTVASTTNADGTVTFTPTASDADGDTATITEVTATHGTIVDNGDGTYTYTIDPDYAHGLSIDGDTDPGTGVVFFGATDSFGGRGFTEVTVSIPPTNEAPTIDVDEVRNADGSTTYTITTDDGDDDTVVVTATGPLHGNLVDNADGTWTYTPDAEYAHDLTAEGSDLIVFTAADGHGGADTFTATPVITPVNEAPTSSEPDDYYRNNTTGAVWGPAGFSDPDGDALTYTVSPVDPAVGTVTVDDDGVLTFIPTPEARHAAAAVGAGPDVTRVNFTITADDGRNGTVTQAYSIKIVTQNVTPTVQVTPVQNADGTTTLTVVTDDDDGDDVAVSVAVQPEHGTVVDNGDGTWTYTPDTEYAHQLASGGRTTPEADAVTFYVNDQHGGRVYVDQQVFITPANTAPSYETADESITLDRSTGIVTVVTGFADADDDSLAYTVSGLDPAKGSVTIDDDGVVTFTPTDEARHAAAADGAPSSAQRTEFSITVDDGHGGTQTQTYQVRILSFNTRPTIDVDAEESADGSTTYTVDTDDADGDTVVVTAADPEHGTLVDNGDGTWTYTPDPDYAHELSVGGNTDPGSDTIRFVAYDGHDGESTSTQQPSIIPINVAPAHDVEDEALDADRETGVITGHSGITDADGDTMTYTVDGLDASIGTATVDENGVLTFTPTDEARHAAAGGGPQRAIFTVTADDGHGGTVAQTYRLRIYSANTAPEFDSADATVDETTGVVIGFVSATDDDGDDLSYSLSAEPEKGSVEVAADGTYVYTPSEDARAAAAAATDPDDPALYDSFTITVDDGHDGDATTTVVVPVIPATNVAPTLTVSESTMTTGTVVYTTSTTDADGDPVTVTVTSDASYGTLTQVNATTWQYRPSRNTSGQEVTETIVFTATDGAGGETEVVKTVVIPSVSNQAPSLTVSESTMTTGTVVYTTSTTDAENGPVTVTVTSDAAYGTLTQTNATTWTYKPSLNASGHEVTETIVFTATDGLGAETVVVKTVVIPAVSNQPPTITATQQSVNTTTGVITYTVVTSDPDGDAVAVTANDPAYGTLIGNTSTGVWTYLPDPSIPSGATSDTLVFTATDAKGASASDTITIAIDDHAPTIKVTQKSVDSATGAVTYTVTASDVDGETVTVTAVKPAHGTVVNNGNGTWTYTPTAAWRHSLAAGGSTTPGVETLKFTATDTDGTATSVTTVASVAPYNRVPVVSSSVGLIGTTVTITDADNDTVTVVTSTSNGGKITPRGTDYIYTGTGASSSATITVSDGYGGTVTRTFAGTGRTIINPV